MRDLIDNDDDFVESKDFSKNAFKLLMSWFFFAALAFLGVVMFYQLFVAILSLAYGFETHVHFGSVDSLPHEVKFWNDTRVVSLYALPSILMLLIGITLIVGFFLGSRLVNVWGWAKFWVMVFSILFANTMLSLSMLNVVMRKGSLFQGFSVICYWYGTGNTGKGILFSISILLDFAASLFALSSFLYLAPRDFNRKKRKKPARLIFFSYLCVIIVLFPVAIFLSFPYYEAFFAVMFIHALLWVPGLLLGISNEALIKRSSRNKMEQPYSNYVLSGLTLAMIILIRIFFS